MTYETKKIKTGKCPACGQAYGYEKEIHSGMLVNEYTECTCHKAVYEKDVYKMHQESLRRFKKQSKGDAVA